MQVLLGIVSSYVWLCSILLLVYGLSEGFHIWGTAEAMQKSCEFFVVGFDNYAVYAVRNDAALSHGVASSSFLLRSKYHSLL